MTPEEKTIETLDAIGDDDPEQAHMVADLALLGFLEAEHPRIASAYRDVVRRQEGWWFA
jgi:hypothetical protein